MALLGAGIARIEFIGWMDNHAARIKFPGNRERGAERTYRACPNFLTVMIESGDHKGSMYPVNLQTMELELFFKLAGLFTRYT
jgi:hypothetical protein